MSVTTIWFASMSIEYLLQFKALKLGRKIQRLVALALPPPASLLFYIARALPSKAARFKLRQQIKIQMFLLNWIHGF